MSGIEEFNKPAFMAAEKELQKRGAAITVINPATLYQHTDQSWQFYMKGAVTAMMTCDSIYMLEGWANSKGAKIEWKLAQNLGMEVEYQTTEKTL